MTIDDLKCCGNCKHYEHEMCVVAGRDKNMHDKCGRWKFYKTVKKFNFKEVVNEIV